MEKEEEILELCRENNKILRGMRRSQRLSSIFSLFYWLFIVGSMIAGYYFIQPLIEPLMNTYQQAMSGISDLGTNLNDLKNSIPSADSLNIPSGTIKTD